MTMKAALVYTSSYCPYCVKAKGLLEQYQVPIQEVNIELDQEARQTMMEASGRRTVPQIFFGTHHIGGCDDLYALHESGQLANIINDHLGSEDNE